MFVNLTSYPTLRNAPNVIDDIRNFTQIINDIHSTTIEPPNVDSSFEEMDEWIQEQFENAMRKEPESQSSAEVLMALTYKGIVTLPFNAPLFDFSPQTFGFPVPPLFTAISEYVAALRPSWRKKNIALKILLATDCRTPSEFDINSFVELHDLLLNEYAEKINEASSSKNRKRPTGAMPVYALLRVIERSELSLLTRYHRHGYMIWRASRKDERVPFQEYISDPKNLEGRVDTNGQYRERVFLKKDILARSETRAALRAMGRVRADKPKTKFVQNLLDIAAEDCLDSPEHYFQALQAGGPHKGFRPSDWLENPINYPGLESVNVKELGKFWIPAFNAYLKHRKIHKKYEQSKDTTRAILVLADYLFAYLPWWFARHPESSFEYPDSPHKFYRYLYIFRTDDDDTESLSSELPKTFYELLPSRFPTNGARNTIRRLVRDFFDFVQKFNSHNLIYIFPDRSNPILGKWDQEEQSRPNKTNKPPFTSDVFPFLLKYFQAVESFGEYLQQTAYERDAFRRIETPPREGYNTAAWGYVPVFWYRGKIYSLIIVPNLYSLSRIGMNRNPQSEAGLYMNGWRINKGPSQNTVIKMPMLTTVRLLLTMFESGLRGQSAQWLDRRTFDKLHSTTQELKCLYAAAKDQKYHSLFINTDKTHDPWDNLVSWRVLRTLQCERHFQNSRIDVNAQVEVQYEDREFTRFGKVLALFRTTFVRKAAPSPKPISDKAYADVWAELMHGFQCFFNSKDGVDRSNNPDALKLVKIKNKEISPEKPAGRGRNYEPIYTPHSCRSTYASRKQQSLSMEEIGSQLGQSNVAVTRHYVVVDPNELESKLLTGDVDINIDDTESTYIHPERASSALQQAFSKSRESTISKFGFIPGPQFWSFEELEDVDALQLLRESPASQIKFHSTHVCPLGNDCPKEIVEKAGEVRRCGNCPAAAKSIDHLPAIDAKILQLHEHVRTKTARISKLNGEQDKAEVIDEIHESMQRDTFELMGWELSAEILRQRLKELGPQFEGYHVDAPEIVRKHLQLVTRNSTDSEFFLKRIADANAFPTLETPDVRLKALAYSQNILVGQGLFKEAALMRVQPNQEIRVFAALTKTFLHAKNLTLTKLAAAIDSLHHHELSGIANENLLLPEEVNERSANIR
jgi:hypothetical protein